MEVEAVKLPRKPKRLREHLKPPRRPRGWLANAVRSYKEFVHGDPNAVHIYGVGYVSSRDPRYF